MQTLKKRRWALWVLGSAALGVYASGLLLVHYGVVQRDLSTVLTISSLPGICTAVIVYAKLLAWQRRRQRRRAEFEVLWAFFVRGRESQMEHGVPWVNELRRKFKQLGHPITLERALELYCETFNPNGSQKVNWDVPPLIQKRRNI